MTKDKKEPILDLMYDLCEHIKWNIDDVETLERDDIEIDRTKVNHALKNHFKGTEWEKKFEDAAKDTLYKAMAGHPMANLCLYAYGHVTAKELLDVMSKDKTPIGTYQLVGPEEAAQWVELNRKFAIELRDIRESGAHKFDMSKCVFEMPDKGTRTALNTILEKNTKLPPIEGLVSLVKDSASQIQEAQKGQLKANERAATLETDLARLQEELRDMAIRSTSQVGTLEVPEDTAKELPAGKMAMKKASEIFGMPFQVDFEIPTMEWDGPHPLVPQVDKHYVFRERELCRTLYAIATNQRAYLHGHTGCGKTTLIEQVAAYTGFPFIRVNFDSEITRMDLIGRDKITVDEDGNTISRFEDGILPRALGMACFMCFDEIDFVRPDVAYVMQAVFEGNGLRVTEDGDRFIRPHPLVRMFATGNTVGQGDEQGMYQGARPQSMALLDRFTVWCHVDYLDKKQREELVKRHYPALSLDDLKVISQYTDEHLVAFEQTKISQPLSPRGILATAEAALLWGDVKEALEMTILDRASSDDKSTLRGIIDRVSPSKKK